MKIVIIGAGNVATQLALRLSASKHKVVQIISKNISHAKILANQVDAEASDQLSEMYPNSDLILISVNDQSIETVVNKIKPTKAIVVHTSGSTSIDILEKFQNKGVFYPFQTFSKDKNVEWKTTPILIESGDEVVRNTLFSLADELSNEVVTANSERRLLMHISAVFACNFTNHLYTLSFKLLEEKGINPNLLLPLISETTDKLKYLSPFNSQTGPALRNDNIILSKHLDYLKNNHEVKVIYQLLSESIQNLHRK